MRRCAIKLAAVAAFAFQAAMFSWSTALAQGSSDVVGTWTLVSSVTEKDGTRTDQFGSGARGMMVLDSDGRFMLTIIGPDLPSFASNSRAAGTPEENKAVVSKSIAMIGTYAVNAADKTLTFKVDSATFPNWNGTEAAACSQQQGRTQIHHTYGVQWRRGHRDLATRQVGVRLLAR